MFEELREYNDIVKIFASNPIKKDCEYLRVKIISVLDKNGLNFFVTRFTKKQAFHLNVEPDALYKWVTDNVSQKFKQIVIVTKEREITYLTNAKGNAKRLCRDVASSIAVAQSSNRRKNYLINEGDDIPILIDLGIFTKERKVVNSMYDKFKQINRFVEILNDVLKNFNGDSITLLDFGCGKSYLTFVIYHYLVNIRRLNAKIIGYDLKEDVVEECNALAQKYRYDNLQFIVADVSKDKLYNEKIDAVVSLHACDTATDYALYYAISHSVKYIFSVPCCQHEINQSIHNGGDFDALLKYGIIKERVSALLTDGIRAMLLEDAGYSVDVMEFVDFAHSPKNIMVRAVKSHAEASKNRAKIETLMSRYGFTQTLYTLTKS
ncbi:MAG: SAM-dependent methyltransferase [Corallococcus sp.]|nr:SAM-dependent methyltransferase [Corallococcus sp.]